MPYIKKRGITYGGFPNATVASKEATAIVPSSIKQLTRVGGTQEFAPVTIPEAVKFSEGGSLETTVNSIATIEGSSTASKAYVVGDFLVSGGQLYKVIANIAIGETFVVDTNIESTSVGSELSALNAGLTSYTLLWTNPDPTSSFSPQTISLDLSEYDRIEVVSYVNRLSTLVFSTILHKGLRGTLSGIYVARIVIRNLTDGYTNSGISFGAGVNINTYGNETTDNAYVIPYKIYGIKSGN